MRARQGDRRSSTPITRIFARWYALIVALGLSALSMCNEYRFRQPADALFEAFSQIKVPLRWTEGHASNIEPRDSIHIRDTAPVIGRTAHGAEIPMMPW